jgi:DNA primase
MSNAAGDVIGIRLRSDGGFKYSVKNGASGLFVPSELRHEDTLLIAEGPTDTAALLDLGFSSIGRPSCQEGRRQIQHYLQRSLVPRVVVVADGDGPGQEGAERLVGAIRVYCADVRLVQPPVGVKDARAWLKSGGTRESVLESIECAALIGLQIQGISYG